jgi:tetratricopeptide (TPR) repeat protein
LRKALLAALLIMLPAEAISFSPQRLYLAADSLWNEGEFRAIVKLVSEESQEEERSPAATYWMCRAYIGLSDYDSSVFYGERAVKLAPDSSYYHLWYGRALGMKLSQGSGLGGLFKAKKVKGEFQRAVELDPTNYEAKFNLMQYLLQAPGIVGGNKDEALRLAEALKESKPAMGHFAKALCHQVREEYDKADWEFRAATAYDTTNTEYAFNYFYFLLDCEDFDRAERILKQIELTDPDDPNILYQRGKLHLFSGKDLEKGRDCFRKYLERDPLPNGPSEAAAHWRMGMIYEKMGKPDSARVEYQRCLELEPDYEEAKKALKKLK